MLPTPYPKGNRTMDHVSISATVVPNISGGKNGPIITTSGHLA